ncbi:hypothetical protein ASPCADRAFT_204124 [Aspergillus carbonarius ITEM 5010]|uniref:Uncharacterized protein n=1 Tax=Aspergillus carbonarius (strain ITEM 5010) TaxID=602072 RepID=A0A1R3S0D8_ASPC5|nr:hypothetical protein ASPCADRAFT_204124 [Aspergillus carbonarius ITEM 5010]
MSNSVQEFRNLIKQRQEERAPDIEDGMIRRDKPKHPIEGNGGAFELARTVLNAVSLASGPDYLAINQLPTFISPAD